MDNPSRSERTRKAALEAALKIIARDGPGRLTLDAIAKEAGISKGGLTHQFPSKHAVLKALLDQQLEESRRVHNESVANAGPSHPEPHMAAQIMTMRKAATHPQSMVMAFLGAMIEEPALLEEVRKRDAVRLAELKVEARDPDLALLRRAAAHGLAFDRLFGLSTLSQQDEARLFDRLLDESQWAALGKPKAAQPKAAAKRRTR
jgi:AcrR family transcriptional regulator